MLYFVYLLCYSQSLEMFSSSSLAQGTESFEKKLPFPSLGKGKQNPWLKSVKHFRSCIISSSRLSILTLGPRVIPPGCGFSMSLEMEAALGVPPVALLVLHLSNTAIRPAQGGFSGISGSCPTLTSSLPALFLPLQVSAVHFQPDLIPPRTKTCSRDGHTEGL